MSYFSFYPFLFYHPYSRSQFQSNLHSHNIPSHPHSYLHTLSYFSLQSNNFINTSIQSRNYIQKNQNKQIPIRNLQNKNNQWFSIEQNNLHRKVQEQLQDINENQQKSSEQEQNSLNLCIKKPLQKNIRKSKLKKLSKKQKKQRQMKRNTFQNSKRNIIPNEIHQMLSIIFKKKKSINFISRLFQKYADDNVKNSISIQRFYLYQSLLKDKINHYANEQSLKHLLQILQPECKIYRLEQQKIYCKISLTLISYFLRNQAALIILNSQRIKASNKLDHLRTRRYLQNFLQQMISNKFKSNKTNEQTIKEEQYEN